MRRQTIVYLVIMSLAFGVIIIGERARRQSVTVDLPAAAPAREHRGETFPPEDGPARWVLVDRAVDGDTIDFYFLVRARGRLHGIDAPESNTEAGRKAKAWLAGEVDGKMVRVLPLGRDKYGRHLVSVLPRAGDDADVSSIMIEKGLAKAWDGRGKKP